MERSDNLCNFYILPLLSLNKSSFRDSKNFINSYLTPDLQYVIVELHSACDGYANHLHYVTDYIDDSGKTVVIFKLPQEWRATAAKFKDGKYSQFSSEAKQIIKSKSGLNYRLPDGNGKFRSAKKLLALDRDEDLRADLEKILGVRLPKDAELVSIPSESEFKSLGILNVQQGEITN